MPDPRGAGIPLLAAAAVAVLIVAGCADCTRDPTQTGLGCEVHNQFNDVYEEDDAQIRRQIAALEARRETLQAEAERLHAEAESLSGERRVLTTRLADLNAETAHLTERLADLNAREGADRQRLAELRAREAQLSRQVLDASSQGNTDPAQLARLEKERADLLAAIESLMMATAS